MRIIFAGGGTGGHLYPGLAIARALVRLDPDVRPFFIGAERGVEREILPAAGFPYQLLPLHPLYRARPWENWRTAAGMSQAWGALRRLFQAERPALVVGTGGYASGAALAYAVAHGIPIALQEQNSAPGMTTRAFARFASAVYVGVPEAGKRLAVRDPGLVSDTGNPIDPPPSPRPDRAALRRAWGFPPEGGLVLLVTGGSQGALPVNDALDGWIARGLPAGLHVIWATGRSSYERYAARASERVVVRPYLSPIADAYAASDLVVARSGALTIAELCAWGLPSVLVPLPTAAADHQSANARSLERAGGSVVLPQAELTADRLAAAVGALAADRARLAALAAGAFARARPRAAEEIAKRILTLVRRT
jgi:UDP-N-acetylglucosamine--N-acetylmuramyl-(pentapeptide) pyrophosphoryl-undecaprenol N-acetylglucosamine transferase